MARWGAPTQHEQLIVLLWVGNAAATGLPAGRETDKPPPLNCLLSLEPVFGASYMRPKQTKLLQQELPCGNLSSLLGMLPRSILKRLSGESSSHVPSKMWKHNFGAYILQERGKFEKYRIGKSQRGRKNVASERWRAELWSSLPLSAPCKR